jgi:hypothetical protein
MSLLIRALLSILHVDDKCVRQRTGPLPNPTKGCVSRLGRGGGAGHLNPKFSNVAVGSAPSVNRQAQNPTLPMHPWSYFQCIFVIISELVLPEVTCGKVFKQGPCLKYAFCYIQKFVMCGTFRHADDLFLYL